MAAPRCGNAPGEDDARGAKARFGNAARQRHTSDYTSSRRLRLPPYTAQQRGKIPTNGTWIFTGRAAWDRARGDLDKPSRLVTLLPLGEDPMVYRWPVVGDEVMVVHTGGETAERLLSLATVLIQQGAVHVVILDGDAKPEHFRSMVAEVAA